MFNEKDYVQVNREERHFGFLLFSTVLYDADFREQFFGLINKCIDNMQFIDKDDYDIYCETALLRDYWHDIGTTAGKFRDETNRKRREVIEEMLGVNKGIIDEKKDLFWTKNNILKSPRFWKIEVNTFPEKLFNELNQIRWAFNAKPDIMIISRNCFLFIEIKLESNISKQGSGYDQLKTQKDIADLAQKFIPFFKEKHFEQIVIAKNKDDKIITITWSEIMDLINGSNNQIVREHFTKNPLF